VQQLPTPYQTMIHQSRYARFVEAENRRETWPETVDRYITFFEDRHGDSGVDFEELRLAITALDVMPSMRALMTAGPALDRDNIAGYNCSYFAVDDPNVFSEAMLILMCGTGCGFSVERRYVNKLPLVPADFYDGLPPIVVGDSKDGWAKAYGEVIKSLFNGTLRAVDYSNIRPAGERLKTFGGRASGPEPLQRLIDFTTNVFKQRAGQRLRSIDCHDILCMVGDVVVCGGVRRSALISLSDVDDKVMRDAKSVFKVHACRLDAALKRDEVLVNTGDGLEWVAVAPNLSPYDRDVLYGESKIGWWALFPWRALANNSAVHHAAMSRDEFDAEWAALVNSGSGERGIFSRTASVKFKPSRREIAEFGTNPCSEIVLRSKQFCNLTEIVVRADDDAASLENKVRLATTLGTLQAGLNDLSKLSPEWEINTRDEALLGVSMTGICDHAELGKPGPVTRSLLRRLRSIARTTNEQVAKAIGINRSAAITCVKPSGTVSQLVDAASGIHARHSQHYIRTVRMDTKDPFAQFLKQRGFPCEADVTNASNLVFSFPVAAPAGAVTRNDMSAIEQLELWLVYQTEWCEHKPSITVSVRADEWQVVGDWVWEHRDRMSGVSFLPHSDHTYNQAPYQECTVEQYEELLARIPNGIDVDQFVEYADNTTGSQELACVGGACEIA